MLGALARAGPSPITKASQFPVVPEMGNQHVCQAWRRTLFCKASEIPSQLRLRFLGTVSRVPTVGALPLCEFQSVKYYVSAKSGNNNLSADFIPAWSIREKVRATKPSKKGRNEAGVVYLELKLAVDVETCTLSYSWCRFLKTYTKMSTWMCTASYCQNYCPRVAETTVSSNLCATQSVIRWQRSTSRRRSKRNPKLVSRVVVALLLR